LKAYADSSFIVAFYLQQQSSPKAIAFLEHYGRTLPFTPWHRLEVRNAIRLAVWLKVIDASQGKTQLKQLDIDLREERPIIHTPIDWTDVLREAEKLGAAYNQAIGCRSANLYHVAASLELGCDTFLTFDDRQTAMAMAVGLTVKC
jgi:hypothetical protein